MDYSIQRLLNDKLYDKRKQGALEYVTLTDNTMEKALIWGTQTRKSSP